ncbi:MAG: VWA domain-containing protein [Deltaproteobacteria bacterium]|nr:VWA domain-containing protein [Deltaproteobacteria bacterium]
MVRPATNLSWKLSLLSALALVASAACGGGATVDAHVSKTTATSTTGANGSGNGNTSGNGSATGSGNATTGSGVTTGTSGSGSGTNASGSGTGGTNGDGGFQACAADSTKAQSLPLDMYIMLDQSGSMSETVAGNTDKWSAVTGALSSFVNQPGLAGISVGIQYFGLPPSGGSSCPSQCNNSANTQACESGGGLCYGGYCIGCGGGGGGDSCIASDYATPEVEIAPLPGVASAITNSLSQHSPSTDTPTSAALLGAVEHAATWHSSHPDHVVIAVLATDGDPTECDTNLSDIDQIAANGFQSNPSIRTFVIGVGSSLSALNGIASAGGTNAAFIVDTTQNVNQQFLDALNNIRGTALGCQYTLPTPDAGTINISQVNVQYTPGGGGAAETIPAVTGASACPASGDAWYYDNPNAPSQIILCPNTCTTVSADSTGQVDILTGCQTIFN